jgi:uncharacterized protein involved in type VI secretion and phage assembly
MSQMNGVVVGIVKSLKDPKNLGRVEVHFPWLSDSNNSYWARIATLMAGSGRGSWFMPEVDDEVLVAFEHGDSQHPYIIGFLWNGQDKPPNDGINTKVRRLKTVSGHVVEFDDRADQEKIRITTQGEHEIEMKDTLPASSVTIKTKGGQEIKLDDTPVSTSITIKTTGGNQIEINDTPPGMIRISVPSGILSITCLQANLTVSTLLSVTAPVAQFSGVVQAAAIVSGAYTPAPGNTFGL